MQWHYAKQGETFGPVDEEELRRLARRGQITTNDLVWNPDMGDKWAPASSVKSLFASMPPGTLQSADSRAQSPMTIRYEKTTHNRDLMRMARESLQTHWNLGIGVMALYLIIIIGISFIPTISTIAGLLVTGPMMVGLSLVFLTIARGSTAKVAQLFHGFERFGTALGAYLLVTLFVILWSLLLIIPGIIATYSYAMTYFVIADDPSIGPLQAITKSKEMMRGNRWKLFCLFWRFFGWMLLCVLTLGIGYLWLGPYMKTTMAHFYDDVRRCSHNA